MTDPLREVRPGEPLRISARAYNLFVAAARDWQSRQHDRRVDPHGDLATEEIRVRNDTGAALPRFAVVGLREAVIAPSESFSQFVSRPTLRAVVPTSADQRRFAIVQEPLAAGAIGKARVAGATVAAVNISSSDHRYCVAASGDVERLHSATSGAARIVYSEAATGYTWALVAFDAAEPAVVRWAKVVQGFTNQAATAPRQVPVKSCDSSGGGVQGEAFYVWTPICLGKYTALFEDSVVGYQTDAEGRSVIVTNCFDDPFGTVKAWVSLEPVPKGWTELQNAAGRFLVGTQQGKLWEVPGAMGGMPLDSLGQHTHADHNAIGTIYYQSGSSEAPRHSTPLTHDIQDLTPPWYAVRWIIRDH